MKLLVGRVSKAHGVRGEVFVDVRTDAPEHRFAEGSVLETDPPRESPLVVETVRPHAGGLLVRFAGIEDRTAAEQLGGVVLVGDSDSSPVIAELDEYWDHELIGLTVVTRQGEPVGEVTDVRHGAGGELLSVRRGDGGEVLVPFVTAMVPAVDLAGGVIVIDPPEGLLEL